VDVKAVESMFSQHESGMRDHSACLWALIMFESFLRQVHGGDSAQPTSARDVPPHAKELTRARQ
jgi:hypothetical protein